MKYFTLFLFVFLTYFTEAQSNQFRLIYLFAPVSQDANLIKQRQILASNTEGVKERDLQISVFIDESAHVTGYKKYKIAANTFTFLLIGKDGGEKFRSSKPVLLKQLFAIIDGMPMRKDEIRKKKRISL
jgi:Domain of unknown function (DUF4174)